MCTGRTLTPKAGNSEYETANYNFVNYVYL
jgi:hypothetical protein